MADKQISIKILTSVVGAEKSAADLKKISSAAQTVTAEQRAANIAAQGFSGGKGSMSDLAFYRSMTLKEKPPIGSNSPGPGWPTGNRNNNPPPGGDKRGAARIAASQALSRYDAMEAGAGDRAKAAAQVGLSNYKEKALAREEKVMARQEREDNRTQLRMQAMTNRMIAAGMAVYALDGAMGALDSKTRATVNSINAAGMVISSAGSMKGGKAGDALMMGGMAITIAATVGAAAGAGIEKYYTERIEKDAATKSARTESQSYRNREEVSTREGRPDRADFWRKKAEHAETMEAAVKTRQDARTIKNQFATPDEIDAANINKLQSAAKELRKSAVGIQSANAQMAGTMRSEADDLDRRAATMSGMKQQDKGWETIGAGNRFKQGLSSAEASGKRITFDVSGVDGPFAAIIASILGNGLSRASGAFR
jgi:hypothetical protein